MKAAEIDEQFRLFQQAMPSSVKNTVPSNVEIYTSSTPRAGAMPPQFVPTARARCAGSAPRPVLPIWRRSA
jgi:hypothetical protein